MDSTQAASAVKQKKGIKKLWAKIKASMRSEASVSQPPTTTATNASAPNTSGAVATQPTAQAQPTSMQTSEPSAAAKPTEQSEPAPTQNPEISTELSTPAAPAAPNTEPRGAEAAEIKPASKADAAKPWEGTFNMSDVIEVDENEDEGEEEAERQVVVRRNGRPREW